MIFLPSVLLVAPFANDNSLGRTYSNSLVLDELGWDYSTVVMSGHEVWSPVATEAFGRSIVFYSELDSRSQSTLWARPDIVWCTKPLPGSFGVALANLGSGAKARLIVDIDDPDIDVRIGRSGSTRRAKEVLRQRSQFLDLWSLERNIRHYRRSVSNPALLRQYGGFLLPHVRPSYAFRAGNVPRRSRLAPRGVFVGSPKPHKGLDVLRAAVEELRGQMPGVTLTITGSHPRDARPWEDWVGPTSLREGWRLVTEADFTVLASSGDWSEAQFPVKLVDAMLARTLCFTYDSEVTRWASGGEAVFIDPSNPKAVARSLALFLGADHTDSGRTDNALLRAAANFTPAAVAPHVRRWLSEC